LNLAFASANDQGFLQREELIMKARTILFPTDFSPFGQEALRWATALARDSGAKMIIIHVEEPPMAYGGGEMYLGSEEGDREELRKSLVQVVPTDSKVAFEHKLLTGDPATAIVETADNENADLIVIGTHGRTGLTRLLMGSVAEAVVRRAKCPVLTVKHPSAVPNET
jgi:nucleotide-binding universal stress UspA family protein